MRAASDDRSRSACCTSSRTFSSRDAMSSSSETADSCSASRPSSPASRPATLVSRAVKSRCARSTRTTASCRASRSRPISSSAAAARVRSALTWPCSRARPSRRSAAARTRPATRRSSSAAASSAVRRPVTVSSSAVRWVSTSAPMACSCSRTWAASASSWSGSRPESVGSDSTDAALRSRSIGQRLGAAEPLPQAGQREPGVLGLRQGGQVIAQGGLQCCLALVRGRQLRLDLLAALDQDRLVGHLLLQRRTRLDQVVGHQPRAGVAHVGLHRRRLASHLGLAAQRLELTADLREQVAQPHQVAVGRVELAERLLLALAVLEDASGLLDEAAPVLRGRVQDRVELALSDDHVHLAADAGVAEQLLDVEQAAGRAVDGVLGPARPEHGPADRDLGVLDRERAVAVVDRQQNLGPAQRRTAGRAGEDDVLHLAAAQRLGALLAHHPGERIHDVGLAGAVRPDDAGDARLELQRRRGREGLEPLQGQALQVQRSSSRRSRTFVVMAPY